MNYKQISIDQQNNVNVGHKFHIGCFAFEGTSSWSGVGLECPIMVWEARVQFAAVPIFFLNFFLKREIMTKNSLKAQQRVSCYI